MESRRGKSPAKVYFFAQSQRKTAVLNEEIFWGPFRKDTIWGKSALKIMGQYQKARKQFPEMLTKQWSLYSSY